MPDRPDIDLSQIRVRLDQIVPIKSAVRALPEPGEIAA
jgi:hypothetical protein